MAFTYHILLALSLCLATSLALPCTSFTVNGSNPTVFSFYRFYDFRKASASTTLQQGQATIYQPGSGSLPPTQQVSGSSNLSDWMVQYSHREPSLAGRPSLDYLPANVVIDNDTQQGGQLFFGLADVTSVSFRVSAYISGDPGAVAGIFTYRNDTQESDIEVLTRESGHNVHFTNQPSQDDNGQDVPGASQNITLPAGGTVINWMNYRLDWFKDSQESVWYVNGLKLANTTINVPEAASTLILNMWSNGGYWSGNMAVGDLATLKIRWIEVAFNSPSQPSGQPGRTCAIDP
ncbi:hypothetical protein RJ55_04625 [Drechmeria coniospora]|nr:hypothetical protein RJ55_04625 [Drechmeria coniospora]